MENRDYYTHVDTKEYHGNLWTIKIKCACMRVCVKAIFLLHKPPSQHILSIRVKALCVAVEIHVSYRVENSVIEKIGEELGETEALENEAKDILGALNF